MPVDDFEVYSARVISEFERHNYLGKAAEVRDRARAALRARNFDLAWRLYHEQKQYYLQHARHYRFTSKETFAIDGSVSEQLANILRLESKHDDALAQIIYWIATAGRRTKGQKKKLESYFKRCRFPTVALTDVYRLIAETSRRPEISAIKNAVRGWRRAHPA